MTLSRPHRMRTSRTQSGVTLIISLIMVVAMTLTGIVLFRQIGTGIIIARNLTFKQGATASADRGLEAARTWLTTQTSGDLEQAIVAQAYFPAWCNVSINAANIPDDDANGIMDNCSDSPAPSDFDPLTYNWANSVTATSDDGAGNEVHYVIHRLCGIPGSVNASNQQCVTIGSASAGGSKGAVSQGQQALSNTVQPYFRITSRVIGPMNTVVYTQAILY